MLCHQRASARRLGRGGEEASWCPPRGGSLWGGCGGCCSRATGTLHCQWSTTRGGSGGPLSPCQHMSMVCIMRRKPKQTCTEQNESWQYNGMVMLGWSLILVGASYGFVGVGCLDPLIKPICLWEVHRCQHPTPTIHSVVRRPRTRRLPRVPGRPSHSHSPSPSPTCPPPR